MAQLASDDAAETAAAMSAAVRAGSSSTLRFRGGKFDLSKTTYGLRAGKEGMPQERFTLENLPKLDFGKVPVAFDAEIKRVIQDCMERPLDDKPRTVAIVFSVKPVPDHNGASAVCDEVQMEVEIDSRVPKRRTKVYAMKTRHDGSLIFHPDLHDDPEGRTIMDEAEERSGR